MNPHNIKPGQTVFRYYRGYGRQGDQGPLKPVTVSKVGSKWFELEGYHHDRYSLETLKNDRGEYVSTSMIYLTAKEFYDEKELCEQFDKSLPGFAGCIVIPCPLTS